jgi:asparagine synthase (glutamine-hydrolysing)
MCGIFALIENTVNTPNENDAKMITENYKDVITTTTTLLNHRGPDSYGNKLIIDPQSNKSLLMLHTRLKINGDNTTQPLISKDNKLFLIINGEIFNWNELEKHLDYKCTMSDCEIIFPLYEKYKNNIPKMLRMLEGQFSFVLYDLENKHVLVARDPIGVTPLYFGYKKYYKTSKGDEFTIDRFVISSELKCLTRVDNSNYNNNPANGKESLVDNIKVFYPRSFLYTPISQIDNNSLNVVNYYINFYDSYSDIKEVSQLQNRLREHKILTETIKEKLTASVHKRLKDVIDNNIEFGVLLSGGLDSSLISSLVVSIANDLGYKQKIKTFSIGVNASVPDLVAARTVAEFLQTDHKEYYFTTQQGLNQIENVILFAESYDCTSIRASTPMFLLTSSIRKDFPNIKILFSGELSDETLCYLYGANAPSEKDFQMETINLVSNVHLFDCLRANKMCMANSFEVRVPFTDIDYVKYILSLHPQWKTFGSLSQNHIEKQILRDSFIGYLPKEILYRKKEQFSDGVSSLEKPSENWIDSIKQHCNNVYTDLDFSSKRNKYTYNRPNTKEELFYREIFTKLFNDKNYKNTSEFTVKVWQPKWTDNTDPSGRVQSYWKPN